MGVGGLSSNCLCEVIGTLVSLLFSVPGLSWTDEIQHVETFAGCASVTMGEMKALGSKTKQNKALTIKLMWKSLSHQRKEGCLHAGRPTRRCSGSGVWGRRIRPPDGGGIPQCIVPHGHARRGCIGNVCACVQHLCISVARNL